VDHGSLQGVPSRPWWWCARIYELLSHDSGLGSPWSSWYALLGNHGLNLSTLREILRVQQDLSADPTLRRLLLLHYVDDENNQNNALTTGERWRSRSGML
jgi:hypothetical protein